MKRTVKKFEIKNLTGNKIPSPQLKYFLGGYNLPEVVILCSGYGEGACYYSCWQSVCCYSGITTDSCYIG